MHEETQLARMVCQVKNWAVGDYICDVKTMWNVGQLNIPRVLTLERESQLLAGRWHSWNNRGDLQHQPHMLNFQAEQGATRPFQPLD